jgi:hypothetical protein
VTAVHEALAGGALPPELDAYFAERAEAVDRGTADVRDGLQRLADHGVLAHADLVTSCVVIEEIARHRLTARFARTGRRLSSTARCAGRPTSSPRAFSWG